jgi:transposase-like protein
MPSKYHHRCRRYGNNRIESDHRHVKRRLRAMQGPRTKRTAWAVIQGIEAVQMIRKGQVLGISRSDRHVRHGSLGHFWAWRKRGRSKNWRG